MASEDRAREASAWTIFWEEQGDASRCLANLPAEVRQALADHWSGFAAGLANEARVLDLGCGAGIVARTLLAARPDLRITGVDFADVQPPADGRFEIRGGTAMEALPFAAGAFDAAVSQFGFEYGQVEASARELARVLVAHAPISFLVHHAESSVVVRNAARARALRALGGGEVETAFLGGNRAALEPQLAAIARGHPGDALIRQVAQALHARATLGEAERRKVWDAVAEALRPEREILEALEASCVAPDALAGWRACFDGLFEIDTAEPIRQASGEAVAWRIAGRRTS